MKDRPPRIFKDSRGYYIIDGKYKKRIVTPLNENKNVVIITERSLYTDKMVFAKMLYDTGKIEHLNYQIYLNWFDTFASEFPINKIVYVQTKPEICHERIEIGRAHV